jgi:hypothetical protein
LKFIKDLEKRLSYFLIKFGLNPYPLPRPARLAPPFLPFSRSTAIGQSRHRAVQPTLPSSSQRGEETKPRSLAARAAPGHRITVRDDAAVPNPTSNDPCPPWAIPLVRAKRIKGDFIPNSNRCGNYPQSQVKSIFLSNPMQIWVRGRLPHDLDNSRPINSSVLPNFLNSSSSAPNHRSPPSPCCHATFHADSTPVGASPGPTATD